MNHDNKVEVCWTLRWLQCCICEYFCINEWRLANVCSVRPLVSWCISITVCINGNIDLNINVNIHINTDININVKININNKINVNVNNNINFHVSNNVNINVNINITTITTDLQPLFRSTCVSKHPQLRTGGFCCKVLLPVCPCWWQLAHSD